MLEWNVYYQDFNAKKIIPFNVFKHTSFKKDTEELLSKSTAKKKFSEELKKIARRYFWSKCEYEVVITSWPPHISRKEYNRIKDEAIESNYSICINPEVGVKIDIYDQLMLNWDRFIDYLWSYEFI